MKKFFTAFCGVTLVSALAFTMTGVAFASKTKPQVYSATEDTPSEEVISSAPGYNGQPVDTSTTAVVQVDDVSTPAKPRITRQQKTSQLPVEVVSKPNPTTQTVTAQYDSVPVSQVDPLVRRLKIAQELITKYGRAYDYRALTVNELEAILGDLDMRTAEAAEVRHRMDARAEMKKQVEAEPAVAAPTTGEEPLPAPAEDNNSIGSEAPDGN